MHEIDLIFDNRFDRIEQYSCFNALIYKILRRNTMNPNQIITLVAFAFYMVLMIAIGVFY